MADESSSRTLAAAECSARAAGPHASTAEVLRTLTGQTSATEVARAVVATLEGRMGSAAALATVIHRTGSAPQAIGAKLLLLEDGRVFGTVGGGAIEQHVLDLCAQTLRSRTPSRAAVHLVRDLGMCCGGAMEVFVEYVEPEPHLVLIGAGHVAQSVAPLAVNSGFRVDVVDDREEMLSLPVFATSRCHCYDADELDAAPLQLDEHSCVLIMARDHHRDEQALTYLLGRPHRYLGLIGSRRKVRLLVRRVLDRRAQMGQPPPDMQRFRSPIGLAIGAVTPAEIAISVLAELIADRRGGQGGPMSIVGTALDPETVETPET